MAWLGLGLGLGLGWGGCYGLGLGSGRRDGVRVKVWDLGEGYQEEKGAKYTTHHSRDQGAFVIVIGACLVRVRVRVRLGVSPTLTWAQDRAVTLTLTITLVGRFAL